jgi:MFS family permease
MADARIERPRPATTYAWYVASILMIAQATANLDRYLISLVLELVKSDFKLSDTQLGLLQGSSFVLLFAFGSIPLGRLADVWSRKALIIGGMLVWSISTALCGVAASFGQLFAARLAVGMGEAALVPAALSLISAYFPKGQLNRGVAVFTSGGALGRAAAFLGGGAILAVLMRWTGPSLWFLGAVKPWRALFMLAGLIGIVIALLVTTVREPKRSRDGSFEKGTFLGAIRHFWKNRGGYLPLFLSFGMVTIGIQLRGAWMVSFLVRTYGMRISQASMLFGLLSLFAGPGGNVIGGWLTDRLDAAGVRAPHLFIIGCSLLVAPVLAVLLWLSPTVAGAMACYVALYGSLNFAGAPGYGGVQVLTPSQHRGVMTALFLCAQLIIGAGFGPLLVGLLSDHLYPGGHMLGQSIATAVAIAAVLGAPLAFLGRKGFAACRDATAANG